MPDAVFAVSVQVYGGCVTRDTYCILYRVARQSPTVRLSPVLGDACHLTRAYGKKLVIREGDRCAGTASLVRGQFEMWLLPLPFFFFLALAIENVPEDVYGILVMVYRSQRGR